MFQGGSKGRMIGIVVVAAVLALGWWWAYAFSVQPSKRLAMDIDRLAQLKPKMTFRECANLLQLSTSDFAKDYRDQIVQVDSSGSSIFVSGGLNVWLQFNIEDQLIGYRVESVVGIDDNHVDLKIPGLRRF